MSGICKRGGLTWPPLSLFARNCLGDQILQSITRLAFAKPLKRAVS